MNYELKTYRYMCDDCKVTEVILVQHDWHRPAGWGTRTLHNCGMTGYDKEQDLCPKCLANEARKP